MIGAHGRRHRRRARQNRAAPRPTSRRSRARGAVARAESRPQRGRRGGRRRAGPLRPRDRNRPRSVHRRRGRDRLRRRRRPGQRRRAQAHRRPRRGDEADRRGQEDGHRPDTSSSAASEPTLPIKAPSRCVRTWRPRPRPTKPCARADSTTRSSAPAPSPTNPEPAASTSRPTSAAEARSPATTSRPVLAACLENDDTIGLTFEAFEGPTPIDEALAAARGREGVTGAEDSCASGERLRAPRRPRSPPRPREPDANADLHGRRRSTDQRKGARRPLRAAAGTDQLPRSRSWPMPVFCVQSARRHAAAQSRPITGRSRRSTSVTKRSRPPAQHSFAEASLRDVAEDALEAVDDGAAEAGDFFVSRSNFRVTAAGRKRLFAELLEIYDRLARLEAELSAEATDSEEEVQHVHLLLTLYQAEMKAERHRAFVLGTTGDPDRRLGADSSAHATRGRRSARVLRAVPRQ